MDKITVNKATRHGVVALSRKLLKLLQDKDNEEYQENVAKFGIPEEYVRQAFAEDTLLKATASGKSLIYLALLNSCKILGFAQTIRQDDATVELDRIVVFKEYLRKGIGSQLLTRVLKDEARKGTKTILVNAGKDEIHARRFYEKNGFKAIREATIDAPWGKKLTLVTYQLQLQPS